MAGYPIDLVLVRHGESEGDLAQSRSKDGDATDWEKGMEKRHSSKYRLTDVGREQAKVTGEYIREEFGSFDRLFVSEYNRALETAALLKLGGPWTVDFFLRDRDWGIYGNKPKSGKNVEKALQEDMERKQKDPFYWLPPGGESIANTCLRVARVIDQLRLTCAGFKVLVVCHGDIMRGFMALLEGMSSEDFQNLEGFNKIRKGQVLHYTRRDPDTGKISDNFTHKRTIVPWDPSLHTDTAWKPVGKPLFTEERLREEVGQITQLINRKATSETDSKGQIEWDPSLSVGKPRPEV